MGSFLTRCITLNRTRRESYLIDRNELILYNDAISTALRIINSFGEEDTIGMSIILSRNVSTITDADQTEAGIKRLIEYLQLSMPPQCPLIGSITLLILRKSALPSKLSLDGVSDILKLNSLTRNLNKFTKSYKRHTNTHNINFKYQESNFTTDGDKRRISINSFAQESRNISEDLEVDIYQVILRARMACVIIDCLATLCCGPNMDYLLCNDIMDFLTVCCRLSEIDINETHGNEIWNVVLQAILCFEKFALTRICKNRICEYLNVSELHIPFHYLELFNDSKNMLQREIGFVSQWLLDNIYTNPNRSYTYLKLDRTNLNAVMNTMDASQYIKFSPIGLEVRCDSDNMESVRCTFKVTRGIYYYEAKLVTAGIMQIGWATKDSQFLTHEGQGIGDDTLSLAFDGFRQVILFNKTAYKVKEFPKWKPGDILGCLINVPKQYTVFSLNGKCTKKQSDLFTKAKTGFYAAASLISNQQCLFNFGRESFKFPPKCQFRTFNRDGVLNAKSKIILPRTIQMAELNQSFEQIDDPCGICFNVSAEVCLDPCNHAGFCKTCISRVESCPLCRSVIRAIKSDPIYFPAEEGESCNYRPPSRLVSS